MRYLYTVALSISLSNRCITRGSELRAGDLCWGKGLWLSHLGPVPVNEMAVIRSVISFAISCKVLVHDHQPVSSARLTQLTSIGRCSFQLGHYRKRYSDSSAVLSRSLSRSRSISFTVISQVSSARLTQLTSIGHSSANPSRPITRKRYCDSSAFISFAISFKVYLVHDWT